MGFWGSLAKIGGAVGAGIAAPLTGGASLTALPTILGGAGAALGAASQGMASNRGSQFDGQLALQRLLMDRDQQGQDLAIARQQEGRAGTSDAWRKLLSAQHTLSPGARPSLSPYSMAPRQATEAERSGADALTQEVMARLQGGNPIPEVKQSPLQVDPKLLKGSKTESILGWLSPALTAFGPKKTAGAR